jgi:hypothetical protein
VRALRGPAALSLKLFASVERDSAATCSVAHTVVEVATEAAFALRDYAGQLEVTAPFAGVLMASAEWVLLHSRRQFSVLCAGPWASTASALLLLAGRGAQPH